MNPTKAITDFTDFRAAELSDLAQIIKNAMTTNAATFPSAADEVATLTTDITTYNAALLARASNATADVLAFNTARAAMEVTLKALGNLVNGAAKGDAEIVSKSGIPSYVVDNTPDTGPPAAPEDLRLKHNVVGGGFIARYKPDRRNSTNVLQTNIVNPDSAADWKQAGIFLGSRAEVSGYTPGTLVWARVATVGPNGVMGAWSDPAQIRVL